MQPPSNDRTDRAVCWIVTDGAAGNLRQARALAQAMHVDVIEHEVKLRGPWRWFAPRFTTALPLGISGELRSHLKAQSLPVMAIGCGRQAASVTRALHQLGDGKTFTVQILDPRIDPARFDVVVVPRHDGLDGPNVIRTLGALNPVDETWLADGLANYPLVDQLPHPRTTLLIGGPRRGMDMTDAWFDTLLARVARLSARDGGSVLIACSRRTPDAWRTRLRGLITSGCAHIWTGPADGVNPYPAYLAAADRIVVTPDSVNMISEACATGKPVFTSLPPNAPAKIGAFHAELTEQGWLRELGDNVDFSTLRQTAPLRELAVTAGKVWHVIESTRPDVAVALARD
ncbi:MAG: mitochondrial fission ELM1 family protein [Rudaea sp.]